MERGYWGAACIALSLAGCGSEGETTEGAATDSGSGATASSGAASGQGGASTTTSSTDTSDDASSTTGGTSGIEIIGDYELAGDLEIVALPECEDNAETPCNGGCATRDTEVNGCQFIASSTIFADSVHDASGTYFSTYGSTQAAVVELDFEAADLVQLTTYPRGNLGLDLGLDAENVYYVAEDDVDSVVSLPRAGGEPVVLLEEALPSVSAVAVLNNQLFIDETFEALLHSYPLDGGEPTVFERSTDNLATDGVDLYFVMSDDGGPNLYRAPGGDVEAATVLAADVRGPIIGFDDTWVYAITERADDVSGRQAFRFDKSTGAGEYIWPLGNVDVATFTNGELVFSHRDDYREYVSVVDPNGENRTIVGYLPPASQNIEFLSADDSYVYAQKGFTMARFRR